MIRISQHAKQGVLENLLFITPDAAVESLQLRHG
jgi:hypothetical protein